MSDRAQTVSCDRLPQRIAARIEESFSACRIKPSRAAANACGTDGSLIGGYFSISFQTSREIDAMSAADAFSSSIPRTSTTSTYGCGPYTIAAS